MSSPATLVLDQSRQTHPLAHRRSSAGRKNQCPMAHVNPVVANATTTNDGNPVTALRNSSVTGRLTRAVQMHGMTTDHPHTRSDERVTFRLQYHKSRHAS